MHATHPHCPQCGAGPDQLLDDSDHGQVVCTSCGAVLGDSLLYAGADQGVYQAPSASDAFGPSAAARVRHLQGALRDGFRQQVAGGDSGAVSQSTSTQRSQQASKRLALDELDSFAQLLDIPDGDWPELHRLYSFVMRHGQFRWGVAARLVAASCMILLSRKLGAPIPLDTASKRLNMDVFTIGQFLGRVRSLAARFYIADQHNVASEDDDFSSGNSDNDADNVDVSEYLYMPEIAAILAPGSSEEHLLSLACSWLDDMILDPPPNRPTLIQAWQQAAARGDVTSLRHFTPLDPTNGDRTRARLRLPTILKLTMHVFESRRPPACALALACIAREAQDATPCSAAIWAALLGSCNPGTALVHQRDAVDAIVRVAKPLPWFHEIKTTGAGRNAEHFLGQILDLVEAGVLNGSDGHVPPSFLRGKRGREEVEIRVKRAMSKLGEMGVKVDSDVYFTEGDEDNDEENRSGQGLVLNEVDAAIESLLVHGSLPVSRLLNMTGRDILVAAELAAQQQEHEHEQRDLDASELGDQDLSAAEQATYIPYVAQHSPAADATDDAADGIPEPLLNRAHVLEAISRRQV
ncbi:hypothetical protein BCR44DRAFT_1503392 [Catenaria anguillulae PL171]|uniref:TFIIB-type domain-containing protein n=1 Tax=Catenaria anguillulae PL171 TaxID=765915 RepID=A0A1Y2H898_9FUNG|nr:hypothetical protein BCR44DRAFT_1503392 [Catenaria anguillulae PL171]